MEQETCNFKDCERPQENSGTGLCLVHEVAILKRSRLLHFTEAIGKVGGSYTIKLPPSAMKERGLKEGDKVDVVVLGKITEEDYESRAI